MTTIENVNPLTAGRLHPRTPWLIGAGSVVVGWALASLISGGTNIALTAALAGRKPAFAIAQPSKASPTGFAAAWAELARDKANAQGAFVSAIPKPNLAKVPGLLL